jgi:hypothetical protein
MDIVKRLKEAAEASVRTPEEWKIDILDEAATEIDTLRAKVQARDDLLAWIAGRYGTDPSVVKHVRATIDDAEQGGER